MSNLHRPRVSRKTPIENVRLFDEIQDKSRQLAEANERKSPTPELRIRGAAAQRRVVSKARIRLDSRKSVRAFKGIIYVDISEFESSHPSHAVRSLQCRPLSRLQWISRRSRALQGKRFDTAKSLT
jgi:hypothetical protein